MIVGALGEQSTVLKKVTLIASEDPSVL